MHHQSAATQVSESCLEPAAGPNALLSCIQANTVVCAFPSIVFPSVTEFDGFLSRNHAVVSPVVSQPLEGEPSSGFSLHHWLHH